MLKDVKKSFRFRLTDIVALVICLGIAFVMWIYVSSNDVTVSTKTFNHIYIDMTTHNKSGLDILSGADTTVDVTVSGKKSVINKLTKEDISAYTVISENAEANERFECSVYFDPINNVTITPSASSFYVNLGRNIVSSVPVRVVVSNYIIDDGYELDLDNIITDYSSVKVTGPENIVSKITEARLEAQIGHVNKKVIYSGSFILVDESGKAVNSKSVTTDISTVTATVPVYKYRDVPVEVKFLNGIFSEENCEVTAFPATVRIKGDPDTVDGEKIVVVIDEKTVSDSTATVSCPITLSDGVINIDGITDISVTTDPFGISSKSISVNLNVKNPDLLTYSGIPDSITIKIRGDANFISTIENYNIYATVDLKGCEAGTSTLPVTLKFLSQYSGKIYEVGEYTVSVTVS